MQYLKKWTLFRLRRLKNSRINPSTHSSVIFPKQTYIIGQSSMTGGALANDLQREVQCAQLIIVAHTGLRRVMNIFTIIHRNEASIKIYDGEFDTEINYSFAEFCMSYRIMFRTIISSVFKKVLSHSVQHLKRFSKLFCYFPDQCAIP